jgi:murein hydrolase activator
MTGREFRVGRFGRYLFASLLTLCLVRVNWAGPVPPKAQEKRKDQIEKLETDLSREREQFLKFNEREKELLDHLSRLEKDIAEKKRSHSEWSGKLAQSREDFGKLREHLTATEKSLQGIEERLARRLVAFYKYSKKGPMRVLSASKDLDDLAKRARYLTLIMNADRQLFAETLAHRQKHQQEIVMVRENLSRIKRLEKEDTDRLLAIKEDLDRKVLVLMKIHKEREFYETAVKELEYAARGLKEKLIGLEKTEVRQNGLPSNFADSKGRLPLPCEGRFLRAGAGGAENGMKGVLILAPDGGDVRAVFPGRVEFSGNLKGYGEIIVINHGSRYFTVTAYLDQRKGEEGKMMNAGDVIGTLGKHGSGTGGRLYFEIRKGGISIDPLEWLKPH